MLSSKLLVLNRWHASHDYLDQRFFLLTLFGAILLHLAGFYIWAIMPKIEVLDVPVHALNIKLSDSDEMSAEEMKAIQPGADNSASVENTVTRVIRDQDEEDKANQARVQRVTSTMDKTMSQLDKPATTAPAPIVPATPAAPSKAVVKGKFDVRQEGTTIAAPVTPVQAHQFVRDDEVQSTASNNTGASAGNSGTHEAELVSHYEQLISLWIQKFKLYPAEARTQGMQGETVVRIRIDRHGNIRYYVLERSTGFPALDHAAIDMIRRANPVPAVPVDYPRGDLMEFLIPVSFHLQP